MKDRTLPVGLVFCGLVAVGLAIVSISYFMISGGVRSQQRGVERDLAAWAADFSFVSNWADADRAIEMLEHVQNYNPPVEGGDAQAQAAIERQRTRTINAIVGGLRNFTKQNFGTDVGAWRGWRQTHGP